MSALRSSALITVSASVTPPTDSCSSVSGRERRGAVVAGPRQLDVFEPLARSEAAAGGRDRRAKQCDRSRRAEAGWRYDVVTTGFSGHSTFFTQTSSRLDGV